MSWESKTAAKIALSVGGTFGHLNPALDAARAAPDRAFLIGIGLKNSPFLQGATAEVISLIGARKVLKLFRSCWQAFIALQKKNPKVIICFGSFHSFPAAFVGLLLGKPIWVFEPNARMGKVTRFFAFFAHKILCYDEKLLEQFPHRGILLHRLHKPIDKEAAYRFFRLDATKPILLVVGGSSGAKSINDWLLAHPTLVKNYALIHLIGPNHDKSLFIDFYHSHGVPAFVDHFISNIEDAMTIADVAISRAGASTLNELNHYRVPTVVIPFEGAYQHQKENAERFFAAGGIGALLTEAQKPQIPTLLAQLALKKEPLRSEPPKGRAWSDIIASI